jgi:hypothetical protein
MEHFFTTWVEPIVIGFGAGWLLASTLRHYRGRR